MPELEAVEHNRLLLSLILLLMVSQLAYSANAVTYHLWQNTVIPTGNCRVHFGDTWISGTYQDIYLSHWFDPSWVNFTVTEYYPYSGTQMDSISIFKAYPPPSDLYINETWYNPLTLGSWTLGVYNLLLIAGNIPNTYNIALNYTVSAPPITYYTLDIYAKSEVDSSSITVPMLIDGLPNYAGTSVPYVTPVHVVSLPNENHTIKFTVNRVMVGGDWLEFDNWTSIPAGSSWDGGTLTVNMTDNIMLMANYRLIPAFSINPMWLMMGKIGDILGCFGAIAIMYSRVKDIKSGLKGFVWALLIAFIFFIIWYGITALEAYA
jgi:hypothetical protein